MTSEKDFPATLIKNFQLKNIVDLIPKNQVPNETYRHGSEIIDYALISETLKSNINNVRCGDYGEMGADHRPIKFNINITIHKNK